MDWLRSVQANLLRDASDGIMIIDQDGKLMSVNPKAMELFGVTDNYQSKTYAELFMLNEREENDAFHQFVLDAIFDINNVHQGIADYILSNGQKMTFHISTSFSRVDDERQYLMIHLTDVTQLEEARTAAENALNVKTNFLQNMTHEIRTPLNIINGMAQILSSEGMVTTLEESAEYCSIIRQHSDSLTMLVNDILLSCDFDSGTRDIKHVETHFNDVAKAVAQQYEGFKPELTLSLQTLDEDCIMETDTELLTIALGKLVHNALKFTSNGSVTIRCVKNEDGSLSYVVEDTGKGIPAEYHQMVFQRFYKVDSFILGAGLGLSVCRDIMNMLHGSVRIDPEYTQGTRFILTTKSYLT